ncbi:DUF3530 family protein [Echinimonas agarilytica]|uniref:Alpha/beta hydrolase family protein n=1 Tax=Echinimonas agarilytica TaxID=1215918 RepID=A0AA41WAI0_9GAMM|nr:DUF3530 family protein [Echinimonas agarilytica]MCM2681287.1 alpha/beta hydrolase family protein [Echinimonas agarilytica]
MNILTFKTLLLVVFAFTTVQLSAQDQPPALPDGWPANVRQDLQQLTTKSADPFAILLKRSERIKVRGTAILVPEAGKLAISPDNMMFLRSSLAELGWDTIVITPPTWPEGALTAPASEDTNELATAWELYQSQLQMTLEATLEYAAQFPGSKMIVAEGTSAASLVSLYVNGKLEAPEALVVLSPYLPDPALNFELSSWFGTSEYPLMDIYTPFDNRWAKATIKPRATAARKRLREDYRQSTMNIVPPNQGSQLWLTRQIHGWIDHLGW